MRSTTRIEATGRLAHLRWRTDRESRWTALAMAVAKAGCGMVDRAIMDGFKSDVPVDASLLIQVLVVSLGLMFQTLRLVF